MRKEAELVLVVVRKVEEPRRATVAKRNPRGVDALKVNSCFFGREEKGIDSLIG